MRGPLDVHRRLLDADVAHQIVQLPRRVATADDLPDALGVARDTCAVVHAIVADGRPHAVVLRVGDEWSPRRVARAVRARAVREAVGQEISAITDFSAGLVAPVGLPSGIPVLVDAALAACDEVFAPVGETTTALKIRTRDLVAAVGADVAALAAPSAAHARGAAPEPRLVPRFALPVL